MSGTPGSTPTDLPEDLVEALRRLAAAPSLLVALDFDGVVAPIVERAGAARALPASAEAVEALARADGWRSRWSAGGPWPRCAR